MLIVLIYVAAASIVSVFVWLISGMSYVLICFLFCMAGLQYVSCNHLSVLYCCLPVCMILLFVSYQAANKY